MIFGATGRPNSGVHVSREGDILAMVAPPLARVMLSDWKDENSAAAQGLEISPLCIPTWHRSFLPESKARQRRHHRAPTLCCAGSIATGTYC